MPVQFHCMQEEYSNIKIGSRREPIHSWRVPVLTIPGREDIDIGDPSPVPSRGSAPTPH